MQIELNNMHILHKPKKGPKRPEKSSFFCNSEQDFPPFGRIREKLQGGASARKGSEAGCIR